MHCKRPNAPLFPHLHPNPLPSFHLVLALSPTTFCRALVAFRELKLQTLYNGPDAPLQQGTWDLTTGQMEPSQPKDQNLQSAVVGRQCEGHGCCVGQYSGFPSPGGGGQVDQGARQHGRHVALCSCSCFGWVIVLLPPADL